MSEPQTVIPELPCPNCQANILQEGFYNYCSETVSLREDNSSSIRDGRLMIDHDEEGHETQDHQCALEAFCSSCNKPLPWAPHEIRELDYQPIADVPDLIADLVAQKASEEQAVESQPAQG